MTFFAKQLHIFDMEWSFGSPSFQTAESPCWVVEDIPQGWSTVIPIDSVCWPVLTDFQSGSVFDMAMQDQIISTANGFYDSQATELEFFIELIDGLPYFGIDWTGVPSFSEDLKVRFATGASTYTQKRIGMPHDTTFPAGERTLAPDPIEAWIPSTENKNNRTKTQLRGFSAGSGREKFQCAFIEKTKKKTFEYIEDGENVRPQNNINKFTFREFFGGSEEVFVGENIENIQSGENNWKKTQDWTSSRDLAQDLGGDKYRLAFSLEK